MLNRFFSHLTIFKLTIFKALLALSSIPLLKVDAQSVEDISCTQQTDCYPYMALCGMSGTCECATFLSYVAVTYDTPVTVNGGSFTTVCEIQTRKF